jgi:1,4-dihydroxy-2-naphthoate octaprenyltransferase
MPVILAVLIGFFVHRESPGSTIQLSLIIPFALSAVLMHSGTNVLNDYWDYRHGVDGFIRGEPDPDPTHTISRGLVTPAFMRASGNVYFIAAILAGGYIAWYRGPLYFIAGLGGALGGYLYTGGRFSLKYRALGDAAVFFLMGPALVFMGVWTVIDTAPFGLMVRYATVLSLSLAFLVTAILHGNNTRDIARDRDAGIQTVAGLIGRVKSCNLFVLLLVAAYAAVVLSVALGFVAYPVLAVFLTIPRAYHLARGVYHNDSAALVHVPMMTARLHLQFSILQIAGMGVQLVWNL